MHDTSTGLGRAMAICGHTDEREMKCNNTAHHRKSNLHEEPAALCQDWRQTRKARILREQAAPGRAKAPCPSRSRVASATNHPSRLGNRGVSPRRCLAHTATETRGFRICSLPLLETFLKHVQGRQHNSRPYQVPRKERDPTHRQC